MPPRCCKIIATVGPASRRQDVISALLDAGVDAFRLNFSYGSGDEHAEAVRLIRALAAQQERPVAIIQDLPGAKIRLGRIPGGHFSLVADSLVTLAPRGASQDSGLIPVDYPSLASVVRPGDRVLLGDGEVALRVESVASGEIKARALTPGLVKDNQGVTLPDASLAEGAATAQDLAHLELGLQLGVDYVALSFVRSDEEVRRVKEAIRRQGGRARVIAKLERREAVDHLEEILAVAHGLMVARGDLGLQLPLEEVPLLQKRIIRAANRRGIPAITATQMLESMIKSPRPTRAEASDVANAVLDGTDAVMLSAETAVGEHPVEAVRVMDRIVVEAEREPPARHRETLHLAQPHSMARAAAQVAEDVGARAIVVFTRSGYSARLMSAERPRVPVLALTADEAVGRQMALLWGITPIVTDFPISADDTLERTEPALLMDGLLRAGDTVVVVRWSPRRGGRWDNFVKLHKVGSATKGPGSASLP